MKFSYNFLQSFFEKKLPNPKELGSLLMMHFFEVEEIEKVDNDYVLDIDILSSRAGDCLSHIGIVREISALTGIKYKEPEVKIKEGKKEISEVVSVEVKGACARYTLRGIENVHVKKSPSYIQKRLRACGISPINNVVDITNYVMLETGQPLHAFDAQKLEGNKIIVRYAKKREKIVTLDEKRYELNDNILVISDELSPIGIAGIKGGIVPEVDENTKNIYLEAANFDSLTVRRGSQDVKIRTDASLRFEHGLSAELTEKAINRAVSMIAENAGGDTLKGMIDYYPKKESIKKLNFEIEQVRSILGVDISLKDVECILKGLEFKVDRKGNSFYIEVPYFRKDISINEDIVEEIGRIYGYDKIEAEVPLVKIEDQKKEDFFHKERACKEIWKSLGFFETYNYSFINEERSIFFEWESLVEVEKPVSLEFKYLRPSLFPNLLKNIVENEKNEDVIRMFEIGKIFYRKEGSFIEEKKLAFASTCDDFYEAKGKINIFLEKFLLENATFVLCEKNTIIDSGRCAKVLIEGEEVGFFGEISSSVKEKIKTEKAIVVGEFDYDKLMKFHGKIKVYEKISKFPSSARDLSIIVPKEVEYEKVFNKIQKEGGKKLQKLFLFDFYEGNGIPKNMKSFAFRLLFQDNKKTLSSEEVNKLQKRIIKAIESTSGWKVRK